MNVTYSSGGRLRRADIQMKGRSAASRTGKGKVGFALASGVVFLLMLVILELNQNRVLGSILTLALSGFFRLCHRSLLSKKPWYVALAGWAAWIGCFLAVLLLTWPPVRAVPAVNTENPVRTETLTLSQGALRGVYTEDGLVEVYAGIPYAKPPVGALRWAEPQEPEPWEGVLLADHFAPMSMQPTNLPLYSSLTRIVGYHDYKPSLSDNYRAPVSEDSLYLNIWKPAGHHEKLPVLVYIHGGSLQTGQPWDADYSGLGLAREGVVAVNFAYRLGVFGYFADEELMRESAHGTTGNYGLLDQIRALEWVRDNIEAFGGDPDNVTVAGESAGAASVSALCTSPLASGLFQRVILESSTVASVSPPHSFRPLEDALESGRALKSRHRCDTVEELRALSAEALVREADTQHHMTVDGFALTETPYESYRKGLHNERAILHGYNSRESAFFVLFEPTTMKNYDDRVRGYFKELADEVLTVYPAATDAEAEAYWEEIWGAVYFDYPHYCLNRLAVQNGIPVYEYYFSEENGRIGPWHSGEEIYCYGNIPADSPLFDARDRELSRQMLGYWKNFAVSGDPNGDALPQWEQNLTSDRLLEFGEATAMIPEREHELFAILDKMDGWDAD